MQGKLQTADVISSMENSAARLLSILENGKDHPKTEICSAVWMTLLGAESNYEIPGKLGKLLHQADQTAGIIIAAHPDEAEAVKYWRQRIFAALNETPLGGQWQNFYKHIDGHVLNYLRGHAKLINFDNPQKAVPADTLCHIRELALEAKNSLIESNLEAIVKLNLAKKLSEIIESIDDYKITGFSEVFDTASSLIGQIIQLPESRKSALRESAASSKIWETFKSISDAAQATSGYVALAQSVKQFFIGN